MPLYIVIDVVRSGLLNAWVGRDPDSYDKTPVATGKTTAQVLRAIAKQVPIESKEAKNG